MVAIVVVLAGILLTVTRSVRQNAYQAQSRTNLRGCMVAILAYANDNKLALPDMNDGTVGTYSRGLGAGYVATKLMDPYLNYMNDAWFDPLVSRAQNRANYAPSSTDYAWRGRVQYNQGLTGGLASYASTTGMNWNSTVSLFRKLPIHLNTIVRPANAYVLANIDSGGRGGYNNGYANVAFADGSVRSVPDISYLSTAAPSKSPGVVLDYRNANVPGHPSGLQGYDW